MHVHVIHVHLHVYIHVHCMHILYVVIDFMLHSVCLLTMCICTRTCTCTFVHVHVHVYTHDPHVYVHIESACALLMLVYFSSSTSSPLLCRVQPGKSYHLFTQHQLGVLADYQLPEMLRTPLEELVLQIKILKLGAAAAFLDKALEPPSETAVLNALSCLRQLVHTLCVYVHVQQ